MATRLGAATMGIVAAGAAVVALAATGAGAVAGPPRGAVENCATRSEASFPRAFTSNQNLIVGPLAMILAGGQAGFMQSPGRQSGGNKFPLLVRAGHRVTIELSARTRQGAGLVYGPLRQGYSSLRNSHRVVTFVACQRGRRSGSDADGRPVTFWSGGLEALSPRCVPLRIWVDAEPSPRHAVVRLGVPRC